ncbi:coiled-coil protein isoform X2 [Wolffia australiana]
MIGLLLELVTNSVILVIRSFLFFKLLCAAGVQVLNSAISTWWILMKSLAIAPIDLCRSIIRWAYNISSFPLRIMTALRREKLMEMNLHRLETQLGNLTSENKQLVYCLDASFDECRAIESVLAKMEQEQDKALEKIDLLENEDARQKLRESKYEYRGKGGWDYQTKGEEEDDDDDEAEEQRAAAAAEVSIGPAKEETSPAALEKQRYVALYRSTFSVVLSVVVGMIAWEADDPCVPLVAALFTVVGLSLASVIQFFSAIRNRPAADAVALLSFNWFVLGALTSPSLPRLVRATAPHAVKLARRLLRRFGLSSWP